MDPDGNEPLRRYGGRLYPDPSQFTDWDDVLRHETTYVLEQAALQTQTSLERIPSDRVVRRSTSDRGTPQTVLLAEARRSMSSRCLHHASQSMSKRSFDSSRTASHTDELTVGTNLSEPVTISSQESRVEMNPTPSSRPASKPQPPAAAAASSQNSDDRVGYLFGKQVKIKGASHVYNDILEGTAFLVQCPVCQSCAQVGRQTKLFLCPVCKSVSKATPAQAHSTEQDSSIAASVQSQEADVAHARLRAKLDANRNSEA